MMDPSDFFNELYYKQFYVDNKKDNLTHMYLYSYDSFCKLCNKGEVSEEIVSFLHKKKKLLSKIYEENQIEFFREKEITELVLQYYGIKPKKTDSKENKNDDKKNAKKIKEPNKKIKESNKELKEESKEEPKKKLAKKSKNKVIKAQRDPLKRKNTQIGYIRELIDKTQKDEYVWKIKRVGKTEKYKEERTNTVFGVVGNGNYKRYLINGKRIEYYDECLECEKLLNAINANCDRPHNRNKIVIYYSPDIRRKSPEELRQAEKLKEDKHILAEQKLREQEEQKRILQKKQRLAQIEKEKAEAEKKETERLKRLEDKKRREQELAKLPQIGVKDFVVRKSTFKCLHNSHKTENIDAVLKIVPAGRNDDGPFLQKVSAGYCTNCKIFFIMESTYQSLRRYGIPLCRVSDEKTYMKSINVNGMQLAQESILMQYGYTVSQTEDLSEKMRHKILAVLIDNNILRKTDIISYLDFFISQRANQRNSDKYSIAISRWERDEDFVNEYRKGEYTQYGVNGLYR